jgi:uncharacterized protein YndB with AHSA1/START domain
LLVRQSQPFSRVDLPGRSVDLRRPLAAGADAVWAALSEPRHTAAWLGRMAGAPSGPGARFELWHDDQVRSEHLVLHWDRPHLLQLSWDFPGEDPSLVTFALESPTAHTTSLRIRHEELSDPVSYAAGWHRHLDYLQAHLTGHDLPPQQFWDGFEDLLALYRP